MPVDGTQVVSDGRELALRAHEVSAGLKREMASVLDMLAVLDLQSAALALDPSDEKAFHEVERTLARVVLAWSAALPGQVSGRYANDIVPLALLSVIPAGRQPGMPGKRASASSMAKHPD